MWLIATRGGTDDASSNGDSMSATIIPLTGAENGEKAVPLRPRPRASFRAALTGAAARLWSFVRIWAEGLGWLVIVASIIAAVL
jgi:hypothetical protein